jgi:hypothetical protein
MEEVGLEDWDFWLSMVEHGKRGTYVAKPLLRWRRHPRGSRNPDAAPATFKRQAEPVRRRHAALRRSLRSPGATFWCALDVAVWPFDRILWLSRSRRLLRWYEELLWRRFLRYYEPAGGAD